mmetsp:Transcript_140720/g.199420  ORF Transcript_140720/g.199420 Transcript_140720/m.199420 type:complete len:270 (-) Transcript_140720:12-821(-)
MVMLSMWWWGVAGAVLTRTLTEDVRDVTLTAKVELQRHPINRPPLPPPAPLCPPQTPPSALLDLYFFHPVPQQGVPLAFANHDMADALGDALFACADRFSLQKFDDKLLTHVSIEVDTRYGGYASCSDTDPGTCEIGAKLPGSVDIISNNISVGRHVATFWHICGDQLNVTGQCTPNVETGSWFSFPQQGQCPGGVPVGTRNCTWSVQTVHRTVETSCLFARGLNASCDNAVPVPGGGCSYKHTAHILQNATNPTSLNPCPPVDLSYTL